MFSHSEGDIAGGEEEESGSCAGCAHNCVALNSPEQWLLALSDFNMGCGLICLSEKLAGFVSN